MTVMMGANTAIDMGFPLLLGVITSIPTGTPTATSFSLQNGPELYQIQGTGFANYVNGVPTVGTVNGATYSISGETILTLTHINQPIAILILDLANGNWTDY